MSWGIGDRVGVAVGLSNIATFMARRNTNAVANTYYGSFNGTTQSLNSPASTATTIGTGDVTFEAYIYPTSFAATACPIFVQAGTGGFWVGKNNSNFVLRAYGVADQVQSATLPDLNKWTHIAIVRSGTTATIYFNGNAVASATTSYNFTNFTNYIGADNVAAFFSGRISNLRLVKGTALYTANFTPPAAPLTAVSGTALLTLQDATIKDNSTNAFTITNTGSVATTSIPVTSLPPYTLYSASYLAVAGGGGGGGTGGGGGAGGLLNGTSTLTIGTTYTVTVGAGGSAAVGIAGVATNGNNSSISSIATASGGGGGNSNTAAANSKNGGSGGGGSSTGLTIYATPGTGISGQGNTGGSGIITSPYPSGGGGGAGAVGGSASGSISGGGGVGLQSSITGTATYYAGGGSGGWRASSSGSGTAPGSGGGGAGSSNDSAGFSGTVNTGGGGGGGGYNTIGGNGGAGGSGIVIISVPTANYTGTVTGAPTVTTSGANTIMQFTSSGSYTA